MCDHSEVTECPHEMIEETSATNSGQQSPVKMNSMDGHENIRSSVSTFVSNRMLAYSKLAKESAHQRSSDVNGNVVTHGASVVERKLAFENAAGVASSRRSSLSPPPPYPEKRLPRADWIRQTSKAHYGCGGW